MELKDSRLADLLGLGFGTPFEVAVAATASPFLRPKKDAILGLEAASSSRG
jgi:hypothetical protein